MYNDNCVRNLMEFKFKHHFMLAQDLMWIKTDTETFERQKYKVMSLMNEFSANFLRDDNPSHDIALYTQLLKVSASFLVKF